MRSKMIREACEYVLNIIDEDADPYYTKLSHEYSEEKKRQQEDEIERRRAIRERIRDIHVTKPERPSEHIHVTKPERPSKCIHVTKPEDPSKYIHFTKPEGPSKYIHVTKPELDKLDRYCY